MLLSASVFVLSIKVKILTQVGGGPSRLYLSANDTRVQTTFRQWDKDDYDLAVTMLQKSHDLGGYDMTPNVISLGIKFAPYWTTYSSRSDGVSESDGALKAVDSVKILHDRQFYLNRPDPITLSTVTVDTSGHI